MTTGTGIAIAGIWLFVGIAWNSKQISGHGDLLALGAAMIMTIIVV